MCVEGGGFMHVSVQAIQHAVCWAGLFSFIGAVLLMEYNRLGHEVQRQQFGCKLLSALLE